ncbi:MAG: MFS transporter [Nitrososphaerota archaeon]|nr:MFS transporter [Nitrososphaerota archaeon]
MAAFLPSLRGIDPAARNLIIAFLLPSAGNGFTSVGFSLYLYSLGMGTTLIGALLSVTSLVSVALAVPLGMLADAHGKKRFVMLGLSLDTLGLAAVSFSANFFVLMTAATFFGLAGAALFSPAQAMLADKCATEAQRNSVFALTAFGGGLAFASGSFVVGAVGVVRETLALGEGASYRSLFLAFALLEVAAGMVVWRGVSESKTGGSVRFRMPRKSWRVVKRFSILGLIGLGAGLIIPLFPLWFHLRFGLDTSVLGPLFGIAGIAMALSYLVSPAMAKGRGTVFAIVATQLSSVAVLLLIPLSPGYVFAGAAMVTRGILMNVAHPIQTSFQMGLVDPEERATATSIIGLFDAVPRAYGPTLGGYLFSLGFLDLPFFVTALLYTASTVLFYVFFRNEKAHREAA